jgi:crotonobetaine/carnitine-CoA ligase
MLSFPYYEPLFPRNEWVLPHILERQATERPDKGFLQWTDAGKIHTFAEVNRAVNRLAHGFAGLGVEKGDRVVIYLPNCLEYVLTWFALSKLGAVEVTIGPDQRGTFLKHQIEVGRARLVVTTYELTQRLAEIERELTQTNHVVLLDLTPAGADERPELTVFEGLSTSDFGDLYSDSEVNPGIAVGPRDIGAILFTSGTTGPSKGVEMPHSQLYWFSEQISRLTQLTSEDVYLTSFPLFHANAQLQTVYACLRTGARCVIYPRFSASDWLGRVRRSGTTVTNMLSATTAFALAQPPTDDDRNHALRCIFAVPSPEALIQQLRERFGVRDVVTAFGQTEVANVLLAPAGVPRPDGSVGLEQREWYEYRIEDPVSGLEVGPGQTGELCVRHKVAGIISDGFLGMPEKTLESRRDLWFHLGDAVKRDENGWYFFLDRLKDTLRRRGENISSFEVEAVVQAHPSVTECAVVAAPADEAGGEDEVKAFVILIEGAELKPQELIEFCESRMPSFAVPRYIEFMTALPKTPSEKVRKEELRKMGNSSATWDRIAAKT